MGKAKQIGSALVYIFLFLLIYAIYSGGSYGNGETEEFLNLYEDFKSEALETYGNGNHYADMKFNKFIAVWIDKFNELEKAELPLIKILLNKADGKTPEKNFSLSMRTIGLDDNSYGFSKYKEAINRWNISFLYYPDLKFYLITSFDLETEKNLILKIAFVDKEEDARNEVKDFLVYNKYENK